MMSDPVMITLIICFTVIFISLIAAVVIRWICVILLNSRMQKSTLDDEYLTVEEFQEYENIVSDIVKSLEDKIDKKDK